MLTLCHAACWTPAYQIVSPNKSTLRITPVNFYLEWGWGRWRQVSVEWMGLLRLVDVLSRAGMLGCSKLLALSCEVPLGLPPSGLEWSPGRNPLGAGSLVQGIDLVRVPSSLGWAHTLCLPLCQPRSQNLDSIQARAVISCSLLHVLCLAQCFKYSTWELSKCCESN